MSRGRRRSSTVGLNPRTGVTSTGPTTPVSAGLPASFSVGVSATANVRDVTVDFGNGRRRRSARSVGRRRCRTPTSTPGTYTVTATATDATGFTEPVSTSVTILPAQPPGVIVTPSTTTPTRNQVFTVTANVTGATSTIQEYLWDFGDGRTRTTTGPQTTISYADVGTKTIQVTVVQATGPCQPGAATVDVRQ